MKKMILTSLVLLTLTSTSAFAKQGDLIVRGRVIDVVPAVSSTGTLSAVNVDLNSAVVPELDFTYMLTNNIGTELILGTSRHKMSSSLGVLGKVSALPPTLTVQYHFKPDGKYRPYVGLGVNYTRFYNNDLNVAGTPVSIDKNSFGLVAQAGMDVMLTDKYFLNLDIKKIGMSTKARVGSTDLGTLRINPWVFGVGVGRRFSFN